MLAPEAIFAQAEEDFEIGPPHDAKTQRYRVDYWSTDYLLRQLKLGPDGRRIEFNSDHAVAARSS